MVKIKDEEITRIAKDALYCIEGVAAKAEEGLRLHKRAGAATLTTPHTLNQYEAVNRVSAISESERLSNFETYLLRQRGLSPRSVYHVLRFADRFLDHRFGDHMLDLPVLNARDVVAFMEHLLSRKRPFRDPSKPSL